LSHDWFSKLTGFTERSPSDVRAKITNQQRRLTSTVNNASYECGRLEIVSLRELRERAAELGKNVSSPQAAELRIAELVGDAKALHQDVANKGALFQVASQFNLLEMVSSDVTPEQGIGIYQNDPTQGPACAVACGAGTIYRNYFVPLDGQIGQTEQLQVDCLTEIGDALGNTNNRLWTMRNGYALPSEDGLKTINAALESMSEDAIDGLRSKLKIGVQWDTGVTLDGCEHLVTQAYCSAMPVAYSGLQSPLWVRFGRLILEAAYEATFAAAALKAANTGNKLEYLTLLGGGAFGNNQEWILAAIRRAAKLNSDVDLDVKIVSYRHSNPMIRQLCEEF